MSKLHEIEAKFVKKMPATWPEGYHEACNWLVNRVRKLETALKAIADGAHPISESHQRAIRALKED